MRKLSDQEIVAFLRSSNRKNENLALTFLHQQLDLPVTSFVKNKQGNKTDAEDILQEGLVTFFKMARTNRLPEDLDATAYLFTICRNLWFKVLKKRRDTVSISELDQVADVQDIQLKTTLEDEKPHLMKILRGLIGTSCYQLLIYFYYEGRKMKEIAHLFSFESEQVAKNKKVSCMKRLRTLIQQNPTLVNAFK